MRRLNLSEEVNVSTITDDFIDNCIQVINKYIPLIENNVSGWGNFEDGSLNNGYSLKDGYAYFQVTYKGDSIKVNDDDFVDISFSNKYKEFNYKYDLNDKAVEVNDSYADLSKTFSELGFEKISDGWYLLPDDSGIEVCALPDFEADDDTPQASYEKTAGATPSSPEEVEFDYSPEEIPTNICITFRAKI